MKFNRLGLIILLLGLAGLGGAELPASSSPGGGQVADPTRLLGAADRGAVDSLVGRLAKMEHATGLRMIVEFHPVSPPAEEDKEPGQYMRALATKVGTIRTGVLAVYMADEDDWRVWIGDDLAPRFVGQPGTAKEFTESGAMHDAKEAWLKATFDVTEVTFRARQAKAPMGEADAKALRRALQAEALIDGLAAKLAKK